MKFTSTRIPVEKAVRVSVQSVEHAPQIETTGRRPHAFRYRILIENTLDTGVLLRGRKWVLCSKNGEIEIIEASGVVGKAPYLKPGEEFRYESYHLVNGITHAKGAFFGRTDEGRWFCALIPAFELKPDT